MHGIYCLIHDMYHTSSTTVSLLSLLVSEIGTEQYVWGV